MEANPLPPSFKNPVDNEIMDDKWDKFTISTGGGFPGFLLGISWICTIPGRTEVWRACWNANRWPFGTWKLGVKSVEHLVVTTKII